MWSLQLDKSVRNNQALSPCRTSSTWQPIGISQSSEKHVFQQRYTPGSSQTPIIQQRMLAPKFPLPSACSDNDGSYSVAILRFSTLKPSHVLQKPKIRDHVIPGQTLTIWAYLLFKTRIQDRSPNLGLTLDIRVAWPIRRSQFCAQLLKEFRGRA